MATKFQLSKNLTSLRFMKRAENEKQLKLEKKLQREQEIKSQEHTPKKNKSQLNDQQQQQNQIINDLETIIQATQPSQQLPIVDNNQQQQQFKQQQLKKKNNFRVVVVGCPQPAVTGRLQFTGRKALWQANQQNNDGTIDSSEMENNDDKQTNIKQERKKRKMSQKNDSQALQNRWERLIKKKKDQGSLYSC